MLFQKSAGPKVERKITYSPPSRMGMFWKQSPTFCVDIGSHSIKTVAARKLARGKFQVMGHAITDPCDELLFKPDPRQDVEVTAAQSSRIAQLVAATGMAGQYVSLLYPDFAFNAQTLQVSLKATDTEKDQAVQSEVKTWIPNESERGDWTLQTVSPGVLHNSNILLMSMLKKRHVSEVGAAFQKYGAYPVVIDMGLLNAINVFHDYLTDAENKDKNIGLLYFGHQASSVAMFKDGNLTALHTRKLSSDGPSEPLVGGRLFTKRIQEHFKLSEADAESYKHTEVFFLDEFVPEQDKITNYQVIKPVFGELVKNLFDITENYISTFREFKVDEVIMTGGGANFANIDIVLGGHLNLFIKKGSQVVSMVDAAGNELPDDVKNCITPAVGGFNRES